MRKYEIQRKVVLYTIVWADSQEEAVARSEGDSAERVEQLT